MANVEAGHHDNLRALVEVAKHVQDWTELRDGVDEANEESGVLFMEGCGWDGGSRDEWGDCKVFNEVFVAVHDEATDKVFEAVVHNCTEEEAFDLLCLF